MNILGLMSGTSLDGMDIVYVQFNQTPLLEYKVYSAETIPYTTEWKQKLTDASNLSKSELIQLDLEYGSWIAKNILAFIQTHKIHPDLISSHGHTIFHQPQNKYTLQIGNGRQICQETRIPVINNFRQQDILLGGQGAPLVPFGDELLFSEYDFCLNLGGFSNVSWKSLNTRKACDIAPCNILLNKICNRIHKDFDLDGMLAALGSQIEELFTKWNKLEFYKLPAPKSLGREWFEMNFQKDLENFQNSTEDLLATATNHIAYCIHSFLVRQVTNLKNPMDLSGTNQAAAKRCLVTGGGAYNSTLMNTLRQYSLNQIEYVLPDKLIIEYKEAILFALLAFRRWNQELNVLASVTGAEKDHCSGDLYTF